MADEIFCNIEELCELSLVQFKREATQLKATVKACRKIDQEMQLPGTPFY